ncbi:MULTISPECIES: hypothetical protein [unclassified Brevibacillus]|uniref:hypothetical protein n=1 Tax=unclassified Brevibacillus TaxID=2684853 RepID=UPI00156BAA51|nr:MULTISPECIES: hypothetical protein [unclassified Brevibacillus]NRQ54511.1 hypothetical protein [Brevibacillus sp. HD1.4A]UED67402.1 hypothetical protein HP435_19150 [Brevibacillus sp. HD3.3A]
MKKYKLVMVTGVLLSSLLYGCSVDSTTSTKQAAISQQQEEETKAAIQEFKTYLEGSFKETSWYANIKAVDMTKIDDKFKVTVTTDLANDVIGTEKGDKIIGTVLGWGNAQDSKYKVSEVIVNGSGGVSIAQKLNPL